MPLKYILSTIAAELGYHPDTVPDDRAYLLVKINAAGKELHEGRDLVNCNREQLFSINAATQQLALPHSVFQLRGVRNYYTRQKLTVHDMRPRYQAAGWTEDLLVWRDKYRSPLQVNITNQAPLTLTIPAAEAVAFQVVLCGSTINSSRVTETVTFAAGDLTKQTVTAFATVDSITNVALHTYDVTITDVDGVILAVLPNAEWTSDYKIVQVVDYLVSSASNPNVVEVLYKVRFLPFLNDYDEFCCPGYDEALIAKVFEYLYAKKNPEMAVAASGKCAQILRQMEDDSEQAVEKEIQFALNPSMYLFNRRIGGRQSNMFPGRYP